MHRQNRSDQGSERGYALFAAAVAALVVTVAGYAFFGLAASENKAARYREDSVEAFYLADAAIERARARFLEDRSWRDGWTPQQAGRGTYELVISDAVATGTDDAVRLVATGRVGQAARSIEVLVGVPPTAFDMALFVLGDADVDDDADLCLEGRAYISGDADFGRRDRNLTCGGEYSEGYDLAPPVIRTESNLYPGMTYYTVRGDLSGKNFIGRVFDQYGNELTERAGNQMRDVVSYRKSSNVFEFDFDNDGLISKYFDERNGVFRLAAGDRAVVVNFGDGPVPRDLAGKDSRDRDDDEVDFNDALTDVIIDGGSRALITATIINTRFTGAVESQRLNQRYWQGGATDIQDVVLAPRNGIALVANEFATDDAGDLEVGTAAFPALVYVTGPVQSLDEDFSLIGCLILLDDFDLRDDASITFSDVFVDRLPSYFLAGWNGGTETSGTLEVLQWREIAAVDD